MCVGNHFYPARQGSVLFLFAMYLDGLLVVIGEAVLMVLLVMQIIYMIH